MKQLLFTIVILVLFLVSSCGNRNSDQEITMDGGELKTSEDLDTCFCAELATDSLGTLSLHEHLYTGICIEFYPGTETKYIEKNILNGQIHGRVTYYDKMGEVLIEEIYDRGSKKRSGEVDILNCNCTELEKIPSKMTAVPDRYVLDDIPYTGTCEELYPESGQIYMKLSYKNGLLDGHSVYYNKDGSTLLIENYENGELVSAVH